MRHAMLIAASTLACSGSAGPDPEPSASRGGVVRRADPTPPPQADPVEPEGTAAPAEPPQPLAADCERAAIDLRDVFEVGVCQVEGKGERIPPTIRRSIEPGVIEVRSGKPAAGAVQLENTGSEPADVLLALPCEVDKQVGTWIEDPAKGQAVDTDRPECDAGSVSGCLSTVHQIRLPPGGKARFPFEAETTARSWDEGCQAERRRGPVARGRYKLRVRALFLGATLDADLVIR